MSIYWSINPSINYLPILCIYISRKNIGSIFFWCVCPIVLWVVLVLRGKGMSEAVICADTSHTTKQNLTQKCELEESVSWLNIVQHPPYMYSYYLNQYLTHCAYNLSFSVQIMCCLISWFEGRLLLYFNSPFSYSHLQQVRDIIRLKRGASSGLRLLGSLATFQYKNHLLGPGRGNHKDGIFFILIEFIYL